MTSSRLLKSWTSIITEHGLHRCAAASSISSERADEREVEREGEDRGGMGGIDEKDEENREKAEEERVGVEDLTDEES